MRPPDAGKDFRVSINTVWYCRVLLLFSFYTSTDSGICLNISNYSNFRCFAQSGSWPAVPASFINVGLIIRCLKLPVVPVGDTGTIPYCIWQHADDFVGAAFDTREGACDGSRWWYINTWGICYSYLLHFTDYVSLYLSIRHVSGWIAQWSSVRLDIAWYWV